MLSKVNSFSINGIDGYAVDIEVDINAGLAAYETVGLPDTAVKESKERVRAAIKNSCFQYPIKRIIINLAPADTKKEGVLFDLPIALGILIASEQIKSDNYKDYIIIGELSLDGSIKPVKGLLPILIAGILDGRTKYIIPYDNANEASYIEGIDAYPMRSLKQAAEFLCDNSIASKVDYKKYDSEATISKYAFDFSEVKGQKVAKRCMEIAVAGAHNILMSGAPGAGKTMLAKCVPTIMPPMSFNEALEVTKVHSVAGILDSKAGIVLNRPFRSPHHTATSLSLIGGGNKAKPGEISLAHNGVLFLDEMLEYPKKTLETLRQPIEDGVVTITRVQQTLTYPAEFMLIASMNPCPCGNYGSKTLECRCSPSEIHKYMGRLSGPLMDRIDLHVEVDSIAYEELRGTNQVEESSLDVKERVIKAREIQLARFKNKGIYVNARMTNSMIKEYCAIDNTTETLLHNAYKRLNLSARGINKILKVARTIADIDGSDRILMQHIAEAIQYRAIEKMSRI